MGSTRTVLYVLASPWIGGGNRSALGLWDVLAPRGFRPVAVVPGPGPMREACKTRGVDCREIAPAEPGWENPIRTGRAALRLRGLARSEGCDLLHSNAVHAGRWAALGARLAGIPHLCHVRFGADPEYLAWVFRRLPKPEAFVFNSEALRAETGPALERACPRSIQRVVPNGVDLERFQPGGERGPGRRIGILANLMPVKGHEDFLHMARTLTERKTEAEYWIVGRDVHGTGREESLRNLAEDLGVAERVRFLGFVDDVPEKLRRLDVLVCASHEEPFGRCLIEAMACGTPVVATRVGGIPEVVEDGASGLLVPPRDPGALADAVTRLLESPELAARLSEAGRRRARERFSAEAHAERILDVYRELWGENPPREGA